MDKKYVTQRGKGGRYNNNNKKMEPATKTSKYKNSQIIM